MSYHEQVVRRALALLAADKGICYRYLEHLELDDEVSLVDMVGSGPRGKRRWFLA